MNDQAPGAGSTVDRRGERAVEMRVGFVITLIVVLFMASVLILGSREGLFTKTVEFQLRFPSIVNLNQQAPVKLGGLEVGRVRSMRFPEDPLSRYILVTISVRSDRANRIRRDTVATARSLSMLSGEKYIELSLGRDPEVLLPGDEILVREGVNLEEIAGTGELVAEQLATILNETVILLRGINEGETLLGKVLSDEQFSEGLLQRFDVFATRLELLLDQLEEGGGLAGRLIHDRAYGEQLTSGLQQSVARFNELMERLESGEGLAGALLDNDPAGEEIVGNLLNASRSLEQTARRLENGDGLAPRLLNDGDYAGRLLDDLETISRSLASILEKIDLGQGSLGLMIEDPAVYEGLRDVVAGVNDSRFLSWLIARKARKGADIHAADGEEEINGNQHPTDVGPLEPPEDRLD